MLTMSSSNTPETPNVGDKKGLLSLRSHLTSPKLKGIYDKHMSSPRSSSTSTTSIGGAATASGSAGAGNKRSSYLFKSPRRSETTDAKERRSQIRNAMVTSVDSLFLGDDNEDDIIGATLDGEAISASSSSLLSTSNRRTATPRANSSSSLNASMTFKEEESYLKRLLRNDNMDIDRSKSKVRKQKRTGVTNKKTTPVVIKKQTTPTATPVTTAITTKQKNLSMESTTSTSSTVSAVSTAPTEDSYSSIDSKGSTTPSTTTPSTTTTTTSPARGRLSTATTTSTSSKSASARTLTVTRTPSPPLPSPTKEEEQEDEEQADYSNTYRVFNHSSLPLTLPDISPSNDNKKKTRVIFSTMAMIAYIDELNDEDFEILFYTDEDLANQRHEAFLEMCGI